MGTVALRQIASRHSSRLPPVDRSITVSAPHRSAQRSFSTSSSVPLETGEAPMLAFTLVFAARPIAIGSRRCPRCTMFAGITMRPAATSSRTCSGVRCASRSATRRIWAVTVPRRACSSCVTGTKAFGKTTRRHCPRASANSTTAKASPQQFAHAGPSGAAARVTVDQPAGRKSHAVRSLGAGMPGVSGELKASGPPTSARRAKLPGDVPWWRVEGLAAPWSGSVWADMGESEGAKSRSPVRYTPRFRDRPFRGLSGFRGLGLPPASRADHQAGVATP